MTTRVVLLEEGTAEMKGLMGSIGAGLAELCQAGWPVPAGFTITTEYCHEFHTRPERFYGEGSEDVIKAVWQLEQHTGKTFGDPEAPLLLAVQASDVLPEAANSLVLLHVGLNDITVEGFARQINNRPYALNCYRILLQNYGRLVHGIPYAVFEERLGNITSLDETKLEFAIAQYKDVIEEWGHPPFPQDVQLQLQGAIRAFARIDSGRQNQNVNTVSVEQGTPVLIQVLVNGEYGDRCGMGTIYSRHPLTGVKGLYGDYTPSAASASDTEELEQLRNTEPELYKILLQVSLELESRSTAVQEIQFIIESGKLYLLHARDACLTPESALKTMVDFVHEGLLTRQEALLRVEPSHVFEGANQFAELKRTAVVNKHQQSSPSLELRQLLEWADDVKNITVLANASHPRDAAIARTLGAEGIGLSRTEHMLLSSSRLPYVQKMVLAETEYERKRGLERLLPMLQSDLEQIFEEMDGYPVTIRLFDSLLDELLPDVEALEERRNSLRAGNEGGNETSLEELDRIIQRVYRLYEQHPISRQRGCCLGTVFPEIYEMQIEAIFRAALKSIRQGLWVRPEIVVTSRGPGSELQMIRELIDDVADQILGEERRHCHYRVGSMIEGPQMALTVAHIVRHADFLSFGTEILHLEGGEQLLERAIVQARLRKPHLKVGLCVEESIGLDILTYSHRMGMDYVSCPPEQVAYTRIAAAQALLMARMQDRDVQNDDISTTA
ncbi:putative PEP-binding protein [Paenibacillus sp. MABNR03]|uniref:putative PEP-binding protein n=1 Tax=Paenibacillus sp. MABNR03 TaxID=3142626 RepID=UPI003D2C7725